MKTKKKQKAAEYSGDILSRILFEDDWLMVVDKPAGILSQPDAKNKSALAEIILLAKKKANQSLSFLAPVHRLDRNTSGVILLAKKSDAAAILSRNLKDNEIKRTYWALVKGDPGENGSIDLPLWKNPQTNEVFVDPEKGDSAITHFRKLANHGACTSLEIELETGRSHQIRAHFSHKKHALVGDRKYGKKPWSELFHRPALHAAKIVFPHPQSLENIWIESPLPEDIRQLLSSFE